MSRVPAPGAPGAAPALVLLLALLGSPTVHTQPLLPVSGIVLDQAGASVAAATVTVVDQGDAIVLTTRSDAGGAFSVSGLRPGAYTLVVAMEFFRPASQPFTVPESGSAAPIQVVLEAGGFADSVVVTAQRVEGRQAETPQKIEIVDATDLERSVASDLTDVLKKNAGVDVIQYSGALSGIGIRGFRPQFSGINKRSLLLIDGRPSGVTNLATLLLDDVERIEVLKGAASAVYGSSAMGGVVNVITRRSRGPVAGEVRIGVGSYGSSDLAGRFGGNLTPRIDADFSGSAFNQRDDFRMGNGEVRPSTSYKTYDGTLRVGVDLTPGWRVDIRGNGYRGRDILTPGDLFTGVNSQGSKQLERSTQDTRLSGSLGTHAVSVTAYRANEAGHTFNVTTTNPLDAPYLPYLSFENDLRWAGLQAKDSWRWWRRNQIVAGFDYERVTSTSRSYTRTGDPSAPFSADSRRRTAGGYVENTLKLRDGRTVIVAGGRVDHITSTTLATPFKTNFTPSEATLTTFNPGLGIKQELFPNFRGHLAFGRAFIPADASMLTGFTTTIVGGRTQISQGNPELRPERSLSFDVGGEWTSRATRIDATLFRTVVTDRFISNVIVQNPPPPSPIIVSVSNGLDATISGLDLELERRVGGRVGLFANATHYFTRRERLMTGAELTILNVAQNTVRAGADLDFGRFSGRVSGRYVQGRKDNDFNAPGFPVIDYDDFTVFDVNATYRLARQHAISAAVNNVFDAFYYEKLGFPLQGASVTLTYRLNIGDRRTAR